MKLVQPRFSIAGSAGNQPGMGRWQRSSQRGFPAGQQLRSEG